MGAERINDLINEKFNKLNFNDYNDRYVENSKPVEKSKRALETEAIAFRLQKEFHAPQSYAFFLKCAWHLTESEIWNAVEVSRRPYIKAPIKYFVKTCANLMATKS